MNKYLITLIGVLWVCGHSFAQTSETFLTLNTSGHTAIVRNISTDLAGRWLLTCSDDKTARLWDTHDGSLVRTFRTPLGQGIEGTLYAGDLSPDGRLVAMGGVTMSPYDYKNGRIFIMETATGKMVQILSSLPDNLFSLDFSRDGKYLAAGMGDQGGAWIFQADSTGRFHFFKNLDDHNGIVYDLEFDCNGNLATVCSDQWLRLYDPSLNLTKKIEIKAGISPQTIAFSPDGKFLATSFTLSSLVQVFKAKNLKEVYRPDMKGTDMMHGLSFLAFSADGRYLYGGGSAKTLFNQFFIRKWEAVKNGKFTDIPLANNVVRDIEPLPDGRIAFSQQSPSVCVIGTNESLEFRTKDEIFNFFGKDPRHLKADSTGGFISFAPMENNTVAGAPYAFSIREKSLILLDSLDKKELPVLTSPVDTGRNFRLTDYQEKPGPRLNGKKLAFIKERALGVDVSGDGQRAAICSEFYLYGVDSTGKMLWKSYCYPYATAVNVSGDGRFAVTMGTGGTLSWYRMRDGEKLATLFPHPDGKRWILYTPTGFYDCSRGAEELIGWNVNNPGATNIKIIKTEAGFPAEKAGLLIGDTVLSVQGTPIPGWEEGNRIISSFLDLDSLRFTIRRLNQTLDLFVKPFTDDQNQRRIGLSYVTTYQNMIESSYYPVDRFFETYYRPDLLQEVFSTCQTDAEILANRGESLVSASSLKQPPLVRFINSPAANGPDSGVTLEVEVTDQGGGIDEIRIFQNGKLLEAGNRGFSLVEEGARAVRKTYHLNLVNGENRIRATAFSTSRVESNPVETTLRFEGPEKTTTLFLFVAGVNQYKNARYNLAFARPDAESIRQALSSNGGPIFKDVRLYELYDNQVTRAQMEQTMHEVAALAEPEDLFVFFFAGHGALNEPESGQQPQFYLIPTDVTQIYGNNEALRQLAVSALDIRDWCRSIKAQKQLIMMDACQSGGAIETFAMRGAIEDKAILQLARSAGVTVLASTGTDQLAAEFSQIGHGVFTYAIVDGLNGNADGGLRDRKITVRELEAYINDLVPELTKKYRGQAQYPNSFSTGMDFPLTLIK